MTLKINFLKLGSTNQFFIFILIYLVISLSKRENLGELNSCLNNIDNIEEIN